MKRNSIRKKIMCIALSVLVIIATSITGPIKVFAAGDGASIDAKSLYISSTNWNLVAGESLSDYDNPSRTFPINELTSITIAGGSATFSKSSSESVVGNNNLNIHIYGSGRLNLDSDTTLKCSSVTWDTTGPNNIFGTVQIGGTLLLGEDDFTPNFTFDGESLSANEINVNKGTFSNAGSSSSVTTSNLKLSSGTTVSNSYSMTATEITSNGSFTNYGAATLTTDRFANNGSITNYSGGTINATSFESAGTVTNNGTINSTNAAINGAVTGSGTLNVSSSLKIMKSDGETYYVDDGATIVFDEDLSQTTNLPTIITGPNTTIEDKSHAANYYLKIDSEGTAKEIQSYLGWSGAIPASELYKDNPSISSSFPAYIYYGKDYNPADYYTVVDGGEISFGYQKRINSDEYEDLEEKPTEIGSYRLVVKLTATDTRRDMGTYFPAGTGDTYDIKYLPKSNISSSIPYATLSGETYDDYDIPVFKDKAVFTAPDGYMFYDADSGDSKTYTVASNYREKDLFRQLRVTSDDIKDSFTHNSLKGAVTEEVICYSGDYIVDSKAPVIVNAYDQDEENVTIDEKVTVVRARTLTIKIEDLILGDNMLASVTVNGSEEGIDTDSSGRKIVTLKMILPGKKTYEIVAKDLVGHTSKWTINMEYLPTATPATPFTVSGTEGKNGYYTSEVTLVPAEGYKISADVNGTFTDTLVYKPGIESVYLMDAAGLYTSPIDVDTYLIDKTKPEFTTGVDENGNSCEIVDNSEYHAKSVKFDVTDDNLAAVIVNGMPFEVSDGKATVELIPAAGKIVEFEIYVEDIAGNANYAKVTVEYLKDKAEATVSVGDKYIGMDYEPVIKTNSDGKAEYYYRKEGSSEETFTTVKPDSVGKYYVQARIPATDNYTAVTAENTFEINFLPAPSPAYVLSGEKDKNGNFVDEIIINAPAGYQIAEGFVEDYQESITYDEGLDKIYLRRTIDGALTAAIDFDENFVNEATATVTVEDTYLGIAPKPVAETNSIGEITYYYKKADADDTTYTLSNPTEVGKYKVQARVAATKYYTAATAEAEFEVKYLTAPEVTYVVSGLKGNNDFYTSDVELNAPEDYLISDTMEGTYKKSITYTEGMDKIYLKNKFGALTGPIDFKEEFKIDKVSPEASKTGTLKNNGSLNGKTVDIKNGMSIYADTLDFTFFDENLATITINGEVVQLIDKTAKVFLDADNKTAMFNIVAEDKAGNTSSLSITLKAAWLENNIIPAGASITLEAGQVYNLEGGKWTVSGDSTVYFGGNSFCVDGTTNCVFTEAK